MVVYQDCKHYIMQSTKNGEQLEKCKLAVSTVIPFECPENCLFHEPRKTSQAGWKVPKKKN
jgi:hypothetical protein